MSDMHLDRGPQILPGNTIVSQPRSGLRWQRPILRGRHRTKFWMWYKRPERIKESDGQDKFYCNLPHSSDDTRFLSYKNIERHLQLQHGKPARIPKLPVWQCPHCISCDCCNGGRGLSYTCVAPSKSRHLRHSRRGCCKHLPQYTENLLPATVSVDFTVAHIDWRPTTWNDCGATGFEFAPAFRQPAGRGSQDVCTSYITTTCRSTHQPRMQRTSAGPAPAPLAESRQIQPYEQIDDA